MGEVRISHYIVRKLLLRLTLSLCGITCQLWSPVTHVRATAHTLCARYRGEYFVSTFLKGQASTCNITYATTLQKQSRPNRVWYCTWLDQQASLLKERFLLVYVPGSKSIKLEIYQTLLAIAETVLALLHRLKRLFSFRPLNRGKYAFGFNFSGWPYFCISLCRFFKIYLFKVVFKTKS